MLCHTMDGEKYYSKLAMVGRQVLPRCFGFPVYPLLGMVYLLGGVIIIISSHYPLVNCPITMKNHHFSLVNPLQMAIFNSKLFVYRRVYPIWHNIPNSSLIIIACAYNDYIGLYWEYITTFLYHSRIQWIRITIPDPSIYNSRGIQ